MNIIFEQNLFKLKEREVPFLEDIPANLTI